MDSETLENQLIRLDELQSHCHHCGLCLETCATYRASGWEQESPRGRIRLARDWMNGKIQVNSPALETFDRCLSCHACETVCPTSVPYGQIRQLVQQLRSDLTPQQKISISRKTYRKWIQTAYRLGSLFWRHFGYKLLKFKYLPIKEQGSYLKRGSQFFKKESAITLAIGCVQDLFNHDVIKCAQRVLSKLDFEVNISGKQPCCGAIFDRLVHGGQEAVCYPNESQQAKYYQQKRRESFLNWMPTDTCFLSRGCQCYIDSHFFNQKNRVVDLYSLIINGLNQKSFSLVLEQALTAYYQPYCRGGKRLEADLIWLVLSQIKGLTLKPILDPYTCCGGYCGEYLFHPEHANKILTCKLKVIPLGATLIVTSFDCQGQFLTKASQKALQILYPIEIIAQAKFIRK
jgi:glycolate oxidase iron-sulfur subunit